MEILRARKAQSAVDKTARRVKARARDQKAVRQAKRKGSSSKKNRRGKPKPDRKVFTEGPTENLIYEALRTQGVDLSEE